LLRESFFFSITQSSDGFSCQVYVLIGLISASTFDPYSHATLHGDYRIALYYSLYPHILYLEAVQQNQAIDNGLLTKNLLPRAETAPPKTGLNRILLPEPVLLIILAAFPSLTILPFLSHLLFLQLRRGQLLHSEPNVARPDHPAAYPAPIAIAIQIVYHLAIFHAEIRAHQKRLRSVLAAHDSHSPRPRQEEEPELRHGDAVWPARQRVVVWEHLGD